MSYLFRVPVRTQGVRYTVDATPLQKALYRHVRNDSGPPPAVLIQGGVVSEVYAPTQFAVAAADKVFFGGYDNVVDDATAAVLTSAGYGPYLTLIGTPAPPPATSPGAYPATYSPTY